MRDNVKQAHFVTSPETGDLRWILTGAVLLVAVSVGAYACTLDDGFINLDDDRFITRNGNLRSLSPASVLGLFSRPHFGAYHPLHMLSYAVEYRLAGRWNPALLHADNVALHSANVVLVYLLFLTIVPVRGAALMGAALFALHPTHVENVAWLSQRKDLLSLLFMLISFHLHVRWRRAGKGRLLATAAFAAFVLALLSKSSAAVLPVLMVAYDRILAGESWRRSIHRALPFVAVGAAAGVGMILLQERLDAPVGEMGEGPAIGRALIAIGPAYAALFLFPVRLALLYPPNE